ncbi:MAG: hypothetical protein NVSMB2_28480 [Chloroflexota bacterium]
MLGQFRNLTVSLVSPQLLRIRPEVREHLEASGAMVHEVRNLRAIASQVDAVYVTRAQGPRFEHARRFERESGWYDVDSSVLGALPANARVLHPLPRGPELPLEADADPRVIWLKQASNGLYVRMALLMLLAEERG